MGKLTVHLDKVTNLLDSDYLGKTDAYVNFHLEQDNWARDKNYGKKNSTVKKDEQNPVYGEVFEWEDVPELKNLTLWVEIRDDDPLKDDKIGKCKVMIEELGVGANGGELVRIDRVVDNNIFCKDARIYLKVKWEE